MSAPDSIKVWVCEACGEWQREPGTCRNVCGGVTDIWTYDLNEASKRIHEADEGDDQ